MAQYTYTITDTTVEIWDSARTGDAAGKPMIRQETAPDGTVWDAVTADEWASAFVDRLNSPEDAPADAPADSAPKK